MGKKKKIMKNWILGLSIVANLFLAATCATLFYLRQYSKKGVFLGLAMTARAELRQDEYLLNLIKSNQNEKAITFLSRNVDGGQTTIKMWANAASWVKLPYTPQHIRDMENELIEAAKK